MQKALSVARDVAIWFLAGYTVIVLAGFLFDVAFRPTNTYIELVKTLFEALLWLAIPFLIVALLLRAWRLSLAMLLVLGAFVFTFGRYMIPRNPTVTGAGPQLRVMTFNTETKHDELADIISTADADIVAIQELSQEGADSLEELDEQYPYQALHPQPTPHVGQGVLSRYPIEDDEYWEYPDVPHTLGHQRVEIDFEGTRIGVYNTHPWPPLGWDTGYNDESHRVVVRDIALRAFDDELPVLLMGDFNMTDNFGEYDLLSTRFVDSYLDAGPWFGYTYPNYKWEPVPPILRLDYVWHSDQFETMDAELWPRHGPSDHSPVVVTLQLDQPND